MSSILRIWLVIASGAALALAVAAFFSLDLAGGDATSASSGAHCTPAVTGDRPVRIVARVRVPPTPWALATNGSSLWVLKRSWPAGRAGVVRIDPVRKVVVSSVRLSEDTWDFEYGGGYLWVTMNGGSGKVWRVDAKRGTVRLISGGRIILGGYITYGLGAAWSGNNDQRFGRGRTVTRIDPRTLRVGRPIWTKSDIEAMAATDSAVWVGDHSAEVLTRIDPRTQRVTDEVRLPGAPHSLAVGGRYVWVDQPHERIVSVIDARARRLMARTIKLGVEGLALAPTPRGTWVVERSDDGYAPTTRLVHVDAKSITVTATLTLAGLANDALFVDGALWVTRPGRGDVVRIC